MFTKNVKPVVLACFFGWADQIFAKFNQKNLILKLEFLLNQIYTKKRVQSAFENLLTSKVDGEWGRKRDSFGTSSRLV